MRALKDYGLTALAAIGIALLIRGFIIEAYRIPTATMQPTLLPGDTIFVLKKWSSPDPKRFHRGQIIVFSSPQDASKDSIRRIVGLPGESIQFKDSKLLINGAPLPSAFEEGKNCGTENDYRICIEPPLLEDTQPIPIPAGSFYVLGDLRTSSRRSKSGDIIPSHSIKGVAKWIWLSIEPRAENASWFPKIRWKRMFREVS